jgi:hypothetical protein
VSAQLAFNPWVIRNAAVSSYAGIMFGIEGGAGYDLSVVSMIGSPGRLKS